MRRRCWVITAALVAVAGPALADPQTCAGFFPPYKNDCGYPVAVWYKAESGGPVRSLHLAPGQSGGQKAAGSFRTVVCRQGETAYAWDGGAHGNKRWSGDGGYECRK